jgi:hypothetical protein
MHDEHMTNSRGCVIALLVPRELDRARARRRLETCARNTVSSTAGARHDRIEKMFVSDVE